MCYAKPGPRCSAHAAKELTRAIKSGDKEAILLAKKEFALTPKGIAHLRAKGQEARADACQNMRNRLIADYTASLEFDELHNEMKDRLSSEEFQDLLDNRTKAVLQYESLTEELDAMKKDKEVSFEDLREKKFEVREAYFNMLEHKGYLDDYKDETAHLVARMGHSSEVSFPEYDSPVLGDAVRLEEEYQPNTKEWLKQRQYGEGGSDIGGILKIDPKYGRTDYEKVFESKIIDYDAMSSEDFTPTLSHEDDIVEGAMARGDAWEPVIAKIFASKHPELTVMHTKASWENKDDKNMKANFDGLLASDGENPDGILEIKTGADARDWENGVPPKYRAQVLWYLEATGLDYAHVAAQIDDKEYKEYKITRGEAITPEVGSIQDNMNEIKNFRQRVKEAKEGTLVKDSRPAHPEIKPTKTSTSPSRLLANLGDGDEGAVNQRIRARMESGESYDSAARAEFKEANRRSTGNRVYVDLETTGFSDTNNEIIEVAWSERDRDNNVVSEGSIVCTPDERFLKTRGTGASDVHGITVDEVSGAKSFRSPEIQAKVSAALNGKTIVAHNASFERRFLDQNLDGFKESEPKIVDSMLVSKYFATSTPDNTLKSFVESQDMKYENAHRALADTNMTADALHKIMN